MGLFRKNRDPLDNRANSVRNQLADLQSQIEKLGDPNQPFASQPTPAVHDLKPDDQPLPRRPVEAASTQTLDTKAELSLIHI